MSILEETLKTLKIRRSAATTDEGKKALDSEIDKTQKQLDEQKMYERFGLACTGYNNAFAELYLAFEQIFASIIKAKGMEKYPFRDTTGIDISEAKIPVYDDMYGEPLLADCLYQNSDGSIGLATDADGHEYTLACLSVTALAKVLRVLDKENKFDIHASILR